MQTFTYSVTDLNSYASEPFEIALERKEDALGFVSYMARELLNRLPVLAQRGMCIAVYDSKGSPVSFVPLDPVQ
jgi:hypothetical protein